MFEERGKRCKVQTYREECLTKGNGINSRVDRVLRTFSESLNVMLMINVNVYVMS